MYWPQKYDTTELLRVVKENLNIIWHLFYPLKATVYVFWFLSLATFSDI